MGSGTRAYPERSRPLGRWLAGLGVHLLTGGGGGVMDCVSEAFRSVPDRDGFVIGVLPAGGPDASPRPGYPNRWIEIAIRTHLPLTGERGTEPLSRNHINVLSSDVVVALPGGAGTSTEVALAVRYERPVVAFVDLGGDIPDLPENVPVAKDLTGVREFVRAELGRLDPSVRAPP